MTKFSNPIDLKECLRIANLACDGASSILNNHFGNLRNLDEKFQAGLVSDADRESEKHISEIIHQHFADHTILGEEAGFQPALQPMADARILPEQSNSSPPQLPLWMIDPLDGTTNFVHQFPFFCISLGLEVDGELVLGVVDAPKLGMRFHAIKDQGAFMNGAPIHASTRKEMRDGLFATGFSSTDNTLDEQMELVARVIKSTRGLRRAGAAALDLCFVANGVYDLFWEKNLQPWDTAAGVVIAREAGAIATTMDGQFYHPRMKSLVCGQPKMHEQTLKIMNEISRRRLRI